MQLKRTVGAGRWTSTLATVVAFGALCATLAYWTMQLLAPPVAIAPTGSLVDYRTVPDLDSAAALFGARGGAPMQQAAQSDVRVLGVAASPTRGSAVLVVGSNPARAYMVGDTVSDDMKLLEVRSDMAILERNGTRIELQAPKRPSIAMLWSGPAAPGEPRELVAPAALAPDTPTTSPRSGPPVPDGDRVSGLRAGGVPQAAGAPVASPGDGSVAAPGDGTAQPPPAPAAAEQADAQASGAPSPAGMDPR